MINKYDFTKFRYDSFRYDSSSYHNELTNLFNLTQYSINNQLFGNYWKSRISITFRQLMFLPQPEIARELQRDLKSYWAYI